LKFTLNLILLAAKPRDSQQIKVAKLNSSFVCCGAGHPAAGMNPSPPVHIHLRWCPSRCLASLVWPNFFSGERVNVNCQRIKFHWYGRVLLTHTLCSLDHMYESPSRHLKHVVEHTGAHKFCGRRDLDRVRSAGTCITFLRGKCDLIFCRKGPRGDFGWKPETGD
jgi:hypothetical protein